MGFVWFAAAFGDYSYDRKEESAEGAGLLLSEAFSILDAKHIQYAPLLAEKIKQTAPSLKTADEFITHAGTLRFSELAARLRPFLTYKAPEDEAMLKKIGDPDEVAVSAYLHYAFRSVFPKSTPAEKPFAKKEVRLAADFGDWKLVKKVNLEVAVTKEVFSSLCSMRAVAERKALEYSVPGFEEFSEKLQAILNGFPPRKAFGKLVPLLNAVKGISDNPRLQEYAYSQAMLYCGYPPYLTNDHVSSLYPELKVPKPKGNFGSKKKKK